MDEEYYCEDCCWFDPCENQSCPCGICSRYVAEGDADYDKVWQGKPACKHADIMTERIHK